MAETYQFTWGEVIIIKSAIATADLISDHVEYAHLEAKDYDLDTDKIGIRIRIPHEKELNAGRETL